jgi:hypothetical protein
MAGTAVVASRLAGRNRRSALTVLPVTLEDQRTPLRHTDVTGAPARFTAPDRPARVRRTDVAVPTAAEERRERREAARRTAVALRVTLVTLVWLVSVSLLVGWGLTGTGRQHGGPSSALAAVLAVLLPFVAAVIATRNRHFVLGGVYVVLTLAMVLPALGIARAGG